MTIYVDELSDWGWRMHGKPVLNCHTITDQVDLMELHEFAERAARRRGRR